MSLWCLYDLDGSCFREYQVIPHGYGRFILIQKFYSLTELFLSVVLSYFEFLAINSIELFFLQHLVPQTLCSRIVVQHTVLQSCQPQQTLIQTGLYIPLCRTIRTSFTSIKHCQRVCADTGLRIRAVCPLDDRGAVVTKDHELPLILRGYVVYAL